MVESAETGLIIPSKCSICDGKGEMPEIDWSDPRYSYWEKGEGNEARVEVISMNTRKALFTINFKNWGLGGDKSQFVDGIIALHNAAMAARP